MNNNNVGAISTSPNEPCYITTSKNETLDISNYDYKQLLRLKYDEELAYADMIMETEPFSVERSIITKKGYENVSKIAGLIFTVQGKPIISWGGVNKSFIKFVKKIVYRVLTQKGNCLFFEAGVGTGAIITPISKIPNVKAMGCDVYVNPDFIDPSLTVYEGSIYDVLDKLDHNSIDIFYWNAVMEHIPVDEIDEIIKKLALKLAINGLIINITPNKAKGPSNITAFFEPRGSKSKGFHFYEYTLCELIALYGKYNIISYIGFLGNLKRGVYLLGRAKYIDKLKLFTEKAIMILPWFLRVRIIVYLGCDISIFRKVK